MSLDGITLPEGATFTPAGGSNIVLNRTGENLANGVVLGNMSEPDFFAREKLYATSRMPTLQGDGTYSKLKTSMRIVRPQVLASGKTVYNLVRIELEVHPEAAATETANLRGLGAAAILDTEADLFWTAGSLK